MLLLDENWREVLAQTPDAELLVRILEADLRPDDAASLMRSWPVSPRKMRRGFLRGCCKSFRRISREAVARKIGGPDYNKRRLRRQLQIAEGRMRLPQLTAGEMTQLQKQVVDLKTQLVELSAVSPARVLDN